MTKDKKHGSEDAINKSSCDELEAKIGQLEDKLIQQRQFEEPCSKEKKYGRKFCELMGLMVDNVPDLIWAKDMGDKYIFANQASCDKLLKCSSSEEAVGKKDMFFAKKERESGHNHTFGEICVNSDEIVKLSKKPGRFLEYGLVRGEKLILDVHKAPFFNSTGEMIGTVGAGRDVTKEKETQQALENASRILRELANEVAGVAILACDEEMRITLWNSTCEQIYGYKKDEALGRNVCRLIIPKGMQTEAVRLYNRLLEHEEKIPAQEFILKDKLGDEVYVYVSHILKKSSIGRELIFIGLDLSPLKQAEEERRILAKQLQQAQKMEAIGTLAGGIAHDFNNILAAMLGYAELAKGDCVPGSTVSQDIDLVIQAGNRAADLIRQILDFSRQSDSSRNPTLPGTIVKETLKLLRSSLPTTITIEQDLDMDAGHILANPTQIHQMLLNLCTNSFHAMEKTGGTISISLSRKTLIQKDLANVPGVSPGTFVQISIKDNGSGFSPALQEKIFDPYFTTKQTGKGTGMGLAIVHGIVKNYGGFITGRSEPGVETVFDIHLPAIEVTGQPNHISSDLIPTGNEHIFFIDDEDMLVDMGKTLLEQLGYRVTIQTSSLEALMTFKKQPDSFDLVITDQTMPEMTGLDLAERMLQIRADLPIILFTGYSSLITDQMIKASGIKEFALKPLSTQKLATLIRKVLDQQ